MYKLPANQEQLEAVQKSMLAFMEQQQKQQAAEISRKLQVLATSDGLVESGYCNALSVECVS